MIIKKILSFLFFIIFFIGCSSIGIDKNEKKLDFGDGRLWYIVCIGFGVWTIN